MAILRTDQINPDGVIFTINWDKFTPNTSFFIPCVNTKEAIRQVTQMARVRYAAVEYRRCVEDRKYGIRFWRIR